QRLPRPHAGGQPRGRFPYVLWQWVTPGDRRSPGVPTLKGSCSTSPPAGMASAARRDGRHLLVLRAALDVLPPDVEQFLPSQLPDRHAVHAAGPRALLTRLLVLALCEAGWPLDGCSRWAAVPPRHRVRCQRQRTLAVRWLLGELDDQVAVPVRLDCDVLGIDGDARGGVAAHPGRGRRSGQQDDDAMNAHERRDAVGARTSFSQKRPIGPVGAGHRRPRLSARPRRVGCLRPFQLLWTATEGGAIVGTHWPPLATPPGGNTDGSPNSSRHDRGGHARRPGSFSYFLRSRQSVDDLR